MQAGHSVPVMPSVADAGRQHPALLLDRLKYDDTLSCNAASPQPPRLWPKHSTNFDYGGLAIALANRSGPRFSCAVDGRTSFCITDYRLTDHPIIFASTAFETMCGYQEHEILGRNCRFLQGAGTDRRVVEGMKKAIVAGEEAQFELVNYKKTGESFVSHLLLVPIRLGRKRELVYMLGVQAASPFAVVEQSPRWMGPLLPLYGMGTLPGGQPAMSISPSSFQVTQPLAPAPVPPTPPPSHRPAHPYPPAGSYSPHPLALASTQYRPSSPRHASEKSSSSYGSGMGSEMSARFGPGPYFAGHPAPGGGSMRDLAMNSLQRKLRERNDAGADDDMHGLPHTQHVHAHAHAHAVPSYTPVPPAQAPTPQPGLQRPPQEAVGSVGAVQAHPQAQAVPVAPFSDQMSVYSATDTDDRGSKRSRLYRYESHNAIEKRRRDRINNNLALLAQMVPKCREFVYRTNKKLDKAEVLELTVGYIRTLESRTGSAEGAKGPSSWTMDDVFAWLDALLLPQYKDAFAANAVDGPLLVTLSERDLEVELRIANNLHRKKILHGLERLKQAADGAKGAEAAAALAENGAGESAAIAAGGHVNAPLHTDASAVGADGYRYPHEHLPGGRVSADSGVLPVAVVLALSSSEDGSDIESRASDARESPAKGPQLQ